jgi:hypothetical protein
VKGACPGDPVFGARARREHGDLQPAGCADAAAAACRKAGRLVTLEQVLPDGLLPYNFRIQDAERFERLTDIFTEHSDANRFKDSQFF